MNEVDDCLAGDPVWELFPYPTSGPTQEAVLAKRFERWLALAGLVAMAWLLYPPLSVLSACSAIAFRDLVTGRRLIHSIPDKSGGMICSRFSYAWGAWKAGWIAFAFMFVALYLDRFAERPREAPPAFIAAIVLWIVSFTVSATLTASGLLVAYRTGMKVWIGEGLNQARMLLLGMLLAGLALGMMVTMSLWIVGRLLHASDGRSNDLFFFILFFGWLFGSFAVLPVLDWLSPSVLSDHPGKFGPKVPTVGKWNSL